MVAERCALCNTEITRYGGVLKTEAQACKACWEKGKPPPGLDHCASLQAFLFPVALSDRKTPERSTRAPIALKKENSILEAIASNRCIAVLFTLARQSSNTPVDKVVGDHFDVSSFVRRQSMDIPIDDALVVFAGMINYVNGLCRLPHYQPSRRTHDNVPRFIRVEDIVPSLRELGVLQYSNLRLIIAMSSPENSPTAILSHISRQIGDSLAAAVSLRKEDIFVVYQGLRSVNSRLITQYGCITLQEIFDAASNPGPLFELEAGGHSREVRRVFFLLSDLLISHV